ncbi:hypothetical protein BY458DRAFT_510862, partial [Sporodiniella umbellata]
MTSHIVLQTLPFQLACLLLTQVLDWCNGGKKNSMILRIYFALVKMYSIGFWVRAKTSVF